MHKRTILALLVVAVFGVVPSFVSSASYKFKSTWKAPGVGPLNFAGKKVAALVITSDQSLEMSAEEALKREITARGPVGVASYTLVPREELRDKDKARPWFERAGIDGVVAMRIVDVNQETTYGAVLWTSSYYGNFWDYYGTSWNSVYMIGTPIGNARQTTTIAVETLLFNVRENKLLWASVTETTDPKSVGSYMKGLVNAVVKELQKEGLARKAS
jgi:hypothetical protein